MVTSTDSEKSLTVIRGRVDSVSLYEVKENELDILEHGDQSNLQFNFAIFLFSISLTGIVALCTATFKNNMIQKSFLFVSIAGILLGMYILIMWWIGRKPIKIVIKTIKDRIKVDICDIDESETIKTPLTIEEDVSSPKG